MTDAVKTMSEVANGNYPAGGQVMFEVCDQIWHNCGNFENFDSKFFINKIPINYI